MKGGFNKIMRNIVAASTSETEFEKRLTKATYHLDSKEPKEKHVIYLLECMNAEHRQEITIGNAVKYILDRLTNNLDNWAVNGKTLIIIHRAM
mmetsp:Transcript_15608/g.10981  ORF Transcript_15608/g.10981 Transcript_15608/m.10981 type:complete len:93 (-) Transcript_15608:1366-1644(-)